MPIPEESSGQYIELFGGLPPDIIKTVLSERTHLKIAEICFKNGVGTEEKEKISQIAYLTSIVLLGGLKEDFQEALEEKAGLKSDLAKNIAEDLGRLIFSPVKESLAKIYHISSTKPEEPPVSAEEEKEEKPERPAAADTYREAVE